jgi:hypothetical protein
MILLKNLVRYSHVALGGPGFDLRPHVTGLVPSGDLHRALGLLMKIALCILGLGSTTTSAAAFECAGVKLPSSIVICSDPELMELADDRQAAFNQVRWGLTPELDRALLADQRAWVRGYAASCGVPPDAPPPPLPVSPAIKECFKAAAQARIAYIRAYRGSVTSSASRQATSAPPTTTAPISPTAPSPPRDALGSSSITSVPESPIAEPDRSSQRDGPFGVIMGSEPDSYPGCRAGSRSGYYNCTTLPRPRPDIEEYVLESWLGTGVCFVKGWTGSIPTDSFGTELRMRVDEMARQLGQIYRIGNKRDMLLTGSIWNEPREWMMGLLKKERMYSYFWEGKGDISLKGDVIKAYVGASPLASDRGYVVVEFYFRNNPACDQAERAAKATAF